MAKIYSQNFTKKELLKRVGNISQIMGCQKYIYTDGKAKDTTAIRVKNGLGLDFIVLPDKALDILDLNFKNIPLAWISKKGLVSNKYFDDKNFGWLRSFSGGMLVTCGMRNAGSPVDDNGEHHGLHGRVTAIPARNVNCKEYWKDDEFYIEISGQIREANTFGENLVLNRNIAVSSKNNEILITDRIVNEGFKTEELYLLYHLNWGFPLFSKDAKLIINPIDTKLRDNIPNELDKWNTFTDPIHDFSEVVYFHDLKKEENNLTNYKLINKKLGISVKVEWDKRELPYLIEWKMMGEGEYVLGLEPSNNLAGGRIVERKNNRTVTIDSFEEKIVQIKLSINEA